MIDFMGYEEPAIDSEPAREPDAIERKLDAHRDRCADCSYPRECATLKALIEAIR